MKSRARNLVRAGALSLAGAVFLGAAQKPMIAGSRVASSATKLVGNSSNNSPSVRGSSTPCVTSGWMRARIGKRSS